MQSLWPTEQDKDEGTQVPGKLWSVINASFFFACSFVPFFWSGIDRYYCFRKLEKLGFLPSVVEMLRYSVSKWTLQTCHPFCPCSDTAEQLVWMLASSHALFNRLLKVACSQIKEIELCRIPFTVLKTLLRSTVLSWHLYLGTRQTLIGMGIAGMLCKEMAVFPIFSLYLLGVMLERPKLWWWTIYQTTTANHVAAKLLCWETEQFSFSKINSHCF